MIPAWASDYVGIPYREKGRDIATGVDCWGLCLHILDRHFGLSVPSYDDAYEDICALEKAKQLTEDWKSIPGEEVQGGDIFLARAIGSALHAGVMLDNRHVLHVCRDDYSRIERIDNQLWKPRTIGFYRWTQ